MVICNYFFCRAFYEQVFNFLEYQVQKYIYIYVVVIVGLDYILHMIWYLCSLKNNIKMKEKD